MAKFLLLWLTASAAAQTDIELGRGLFQTHCSYCHGAHGEGGRGPDLTTGRFKHGGSTTELFASIRKTPALKRGGTYRHTEVIRLPTTLTPGSYAAYTVLDNSDQVRESNTENNYLGFVHFGIGPKPTQLPP